MSDVLHGTATWPGVPAGVCISCSYTASHGTSPGVAAFLMPSQDGPPDGYGDLHITDGGRTVPLVGCKVDKIDISQNGRVWQLAILDRRWRWVNGQISGSYNVRDEKNEIVEVTRRTALQLGNLCLDAMGELTTAIVDGLPTDQFPPVEWVAANPAASLESIAGQFACRVVYQPIANRVAVCRMGVGADLPDLPMAQDSPTLDVPETPDSIILVGAETEHEVYIPLEAVGLDADGKVKVLDFLHYKPAAGWEYTCPGNIGTYTKLAPNPQYEETTQADLNKKIEGLILETVYKWYRIKAGAVDGSGGDLLVPGYGGVNDPWQIIISDHLVGTAVNIDGALVARPAEVRGKFHRQRQLKTADIDVFKTSLASEKIDTPFTIDPVQGLVKFSDPVQRIELEQADGSSRTYPALLVLRCAVRIRDKVTSAVVRLTRQMDLGGANNTGPEIVLRPEVKLQVAGEYTLRPGVPLLSAPQWLLTKITDNGAAMDTLADTFLDRAASRYETTASQARDYPGAIPIDPDGAIQQVTWSIGGGAPPMTSASRNSEHAFWLPSHEEMRRVRFLREEAKPLQAPKVVDVEAMKRRWRGTA